MTTASSRPAGLLPAVAEQRKSARLQHPNVRASVRRQRREGRARAGARSGRPLGAKARAWRRFFGAFAQTLVDRARRALCRFGLGYGCVSEPRASASCRGRLDRENSPPLDGALVVRHSPQNFRERPPSRASPASSQSEVLTTLTARVRRPHRDAALVRAVRMRSRGPPSCTLKLHIISVQPPRCST